MVHGHCVSDTSQGLVVDVFQFLGRISLYYGDTLPIGLRQFFGRICYGRGTIDHGLNWKWWMVLAMLVVASSAHAETEGEKRFFAKCPHRRTVQLHHEGAPFDPHTLLYTIVGVSEVEILRAADWFIDLWLPVPPVRPFYRATQTIRAEYDGLPPWRARQRLGELIDAFQLPELSFGDVTTTHSVALSNAKGPGSGMVVRVYKSIDWMQHVAGDVNQFAGQAVRRRRGLVYWSLPGQMIDGTQWFLLKAYNHCSILISRSIDGGLTAVEAGTGRLINLGCRKPHEEQTVFLRLTPEEYWTHEPWLLEHRNRVVVGDVESFRRSTHAALAHRRRSTRRSKRSPADELRGVLDIVVMTDTVAISRAPEALRTYVVPAAWVLDESSVVATKLIDQGTEGTREVGTSR